jgi:hypothetical protein
MRWIGAFGRFWYDFIVGDSLVLALGVPSAIVLAWVLSRAGAVGVAEAMLPPAVLGILAASLRAQHGIRVEVTTEDRRPE